MNKLASVILQEINEYLDSKSSIYFINLNSIFRKSIYPTRVYDGSKLTGTDIIHYRFKRLKYLDISINKI